MIRESVVNMDSIIKKDAEKAVKEFEKELEILEKYGASVEVVEAFKRGIRAGVEIAGSIYRGHPEDSSEVPQNEQKKETLNVNPINLPVDPLKPVDWDSFNKAKEQIDKISEGNGKRKKKDYSNTDIHRRNYRTRNFHDKCLVNILKEEGKEMPVHEIMEKLQSKFGIKIKKKSHTGFILGAIERGRPIKKVGFGLYKYSL